MFLFGVRCLRFQVTRFVYCLKCGFDFGLFCFGWFCVLILVWICVCLLVFVFVCCVLWLVSSLLGFVLFRMCLCFWFAFGFVILVCSEFGVLRFDSKCCDFLFCLLWDCSVCFCGLRLWFGWFVLCVLLLMFLRC